jgi:cleavage and polyadenylation specificity factor subunit 3
MTAAAWPVACAEAAAAAAAAAATASGRGDAARFDTARLRVGELVDVVYREGNPEAGYERHVVVEWAGGPAGDLVADAVVAVLLQAAGEPLAAAEAETARRDALAAGDKAGAAAAELSLLAALLGAQFGVAVADVEAGVVRVAVDKAAAVVDPRSSQVACDDDALRGRLERALERAIIAMRPAAVDADRPL